MRLWFLYTKWCLILILLSEIPEGAKYFSVIDLKDAFYSVPLVEESQFLFAFEEPYAASFSVNLDSFAPRIS